MKTLAAAAGAALLLVSVLVFAGATDDRPRGGVDGTAISPTTVTASGLITASGGVTLGASQDLTCVGATGATCIYDELGATCGTRTDDANSVNRTINTSDVYPFATAARTPGSLMLRGGLDSKTVGCVQATCDATDTVIVTRIINGTSTANTLTYGTDFCTGTTCTDPASAVLDNEAMATSLAAAIEALSGVGSTASGAICSGGVADSRCVGVTADRLTSSIVITESNAHAACTVITLGTDGGVQLSTILQNGDGSATLPAYTFFSDPDTGVYRYAANGLAIAVAGGAMLSINTTGITSYGTIAGPSTITSTSTTTIGWSKQSAANQACTTTCTSACVFGQNTADMTIVDCADATADVCICAGST